MNMKDSRERLLGVGVVSFNFVELDLILFGVGDFDI